MARQTIIKNWDELPQFFDIEMFMRLIGATSREYVRQKCKKGEYPAFRNGKEYLFDKDDVREWKRQNSIMKLDAGAGNNGVQP